MDEPPKLLNKLRFSLYIAIVIFSIIRWILTCIDKKLFDFIIILDLFLSLLLIISFSFSIFIIKSEGLVPLSTFIIIFAFNFVLIAGNTIAAIYTYKNSRKKDFQDICIFIIVIRTIISIIFNMLNYTIYRG